MVPLYRWISWIGFWLYHLGCPSLRLLLLRTILKSDTVLCCCHHHRLDIVVFFFSLSSWYCCINLPNQNGFGVRVVVVIDVDALGRRFGALADDDDDDDGLWWIASVQHCPFDKRIQTTEKHMKTKRVLLSRLLRWIIVDVDVVNDDGIVVCTSPVFSLYSIRDMYRSYQVYSNYGNQNNITSNNMKWYRVVGVYTTDCWYSQPPLPLPGLCQRLYNRTQRKRVE